MTVKISLVAADCLLLGLQPVLVHISKNAAGQYSFSPVAINFLVELLKTGFALATLLMLGTGRPGPPMYRSVRAFLVDAHHNRLLAVPALLYAINNQLKFSMQLFFRPTTTKMLGNLKIFAIAVLMRGVLGRTFTVLQWQALFLLVAGITVNQVGGACPVPGVTELMPPLIPAVLCTIGTCTVPSAASVYNEFALKQHMDTSVHLQSFFLYFYGMLFNLAALLAYSAWQGHGLSSMFAGQGVVTSLLIANNAMQGILASFFYKFADTILKKYSATIATVATAIMSYFMFGHALTINFLLGVSIVFVSMHQFFTGGQAPNQMEAYSTTPGKTVYSPSSVLTPFTSSGRTDSLSVPNGQYSKTDKPTPGSVGITIVGQAGGAPGVGSPPGMADYR